MVAEGLAHAVKGAHVIGDAGFKPHSLVRLLLRAKPRSLLLRSLAPPLKFGPTLPYGPAVKQDELLVERSNLDLAGCMERVVRELSQSVGHDDQVAMMHAGRA